MPNFSSHEKVFSFVTTHIELFPFFENFNNFFHENLIISQK